MDDGKPVTEDQLEKVKRPHVIRPHVVRALADKPGFRGRGLLARFLFAMPTGSLIRRLFRTESRRVAGPSFRGGGRGL